MRVKGGYATLGHLYKSALQIPGASWASRTPFKSINRIVQDPRYFFRIRPGLWGLLDQKDKLPADLRSRSAPESDHSYYQGLLVELGNLRQQQTFVPRQDRGRKFLGRPLGDLATLADIHPFTYDEVVRRSASVDVIWFNERKMPSGFFEVENTTDMHSALLKFVLLDAFHADFRIVAPIARQREFQTKIAHPSFASVRGRARFTSYETISQLHSKESELAAARKAW
jgi:hypothetical protein